MLSEMLSAYNSYMSEIFNNNEFLIGMVTTALGGGIVYTLKRLWEFGVTQFKKHLTTTIELDSMNDSYHKVMRYISEKKIIQKSRYLLITNGAWGYEPPVLSLGTGFQFMRLFGKFCAIYIKQIDNRERLLYKMYITYLGRSHKLADKLMDVAKHTKNDDVTEVIVVGSDKVYEQRREYMKNRFYVEAEHKLLNAVKQFVESEEDFIKKNIPYKLGVLLYGPPGTGKTSVIRAIAGEIGYKICIINSFSDFDKIPNEKCIVILDEIDMMVGKRDLENNTGTNETKKDQKSLIDELKQYSLSEALKKLDGIVQKHGVIVIATTNQPEKLDKALLRPGRLGIQIEFGYIKPKEFESAVNKYYETNYKLDGELVKCTSAELMGAYIEGLTKEQFINRFVKNRKGD